jgi:hypothetical protein
MGSDSRHRAWHGSRWRWGLAGVLLLLGLAGLAGLAGNRWQLAKQSAAARATAPALAPALVPGSMLFLNQTSEHQYDRALKSSIRFFQQRTHIQLGIILLPALPDGQAIEQVAVQRFADYRIGQAREGRGLLLLWAEREHLFKIEVGYALEGVFPDALCRRLEAGARTFMLSRSAFARRDFLTELIVTMGLHYLDYRKNGKVDELILPSAGPGQGLSLQMGAHLSGGAGLVGRGYAASAEQVARELIAISPAIAAEMQPAAEAQVVLERYLQSLARGIGAPQLPLLTEGSRYFRINKPHAPGYLQRMADYYRKAGPATLLEHGALAAALYPESAPVLPILLRKMADGLWYIDEVHAWAYFHLAEDGSSVPKYADAPYAFAWAARPGQAARQAVYFDRAATPPLLDALNATAATAAAADASAAANPLLVRVAQAEQVLREHPERADAWRHLAELLHFEMYWLEAAAPLYEQALKLAPGRIELHWRLIDVYLNTSDIDALERQYHALLHVTPDDALLQHYYAWFQKNYVWPEAAGAR